MKERENRKGIISEVARFIMNFADYSDKDTFHIPIEVMKLLICGIIPEIDECAEVETKK